MIKKVIESLDRLEDKIRRKLSRYPSLYALIGGIGVVLFWRGVWHISDDINLSSSISFVIGIIILIVTGLFVSEFIGKRLIISGLIGEEKLTEKEGGEIKKEESEIETEETQLRNLQNTLSKLEKKLDHIDEEIGEKK